MAILLVVAFHAGFASGGWMGVSLFFVLSGYLITGLLMSEQQKTGRVALGAFYRRRAARLVPALTICMIVLPVLVVAVVGTRYRDAALGDSLAALLYLTDIGVTLFGYTPFGFVFFTWSLALEEHFYLAWPTVFRRLHNFQRAARWLLVVSLLIVVVRTAGPWSDLTAYTAPWFRADALLVGCALALVNARLPRSAGAVGVVMLAAATVFCEELSDVGMIAGTVGSALVICAAPRLPGLCARWLQHFGHISYALYLWNSTLMCVWMAKVGSDRPWPHVLVWFALSMILAEASTWLIERPLRRRWSGRHDSEVLEPRGTAVVPQTVAGIGQEEVGRIGVRAVRGTVL